MRLSIELIRLEKQRLHHVIDQLWELELVDCRMKVSIMCDSVMRNK
jgi:hypothetical protein